MAELVGVFAACHAPPIIRAWDTMRADRRQGLATAYAELRRQIVASRADVIVMIGADHWTNFFLENFPAICMGVGAEHGGPPEAWLSGYPYQMLGHPGLAMHLADHAFASGFEPSLSHHLNLDHAFCVPLWRMAFETLPRIVPVVINGLQPPLPTVARCLAFGAMLADAVATFDGPARVAVLASGGLSHSVGEPIMGDIDENFDRECIGLFEAGMPEPLLAYLTDARMARAGNGASELRFWVAAHGAARCRGFELLHYEAVPEVLTGCGFASWSI